MFVLRVDPTGISTFIFFAATIAMLVRLRNNPTSVSPWIPHPVVLVCNPMV